MHRRVLLSSVTALLLAGLSGCLTDARRVTGGCIRVDTGHSELHPADERYVNGSLSGDADSRGWLFSDSSADQRGVFIDRAMQGQYPNDLLETDGDSFVLLFEVRMLREDAMSYDTAFSPLWVGWRDADIPIWRSPSVDPKVFEADADTLICTRFSTFDVARGAAPTNTALWVFERDDESGTTHGSDPEQTVAICRIGR